MNALSSLIATAPALKLGPETTWGEHVEFILVGFAWVITLTILCMVTILISRLIPKAKPAATAHATTATPAPVATSGIPAEHLAIITAAVYATLGESNRIVSVRATGPGWAQEGRREHFDSHRLR